MKERTPFGTMGGVRLLSLSLSLCLSLVSIISAAEIVVDAGEAVITEDADVGISAGNYAGV